MRVQKIRRVGTLFDIEETTMKYVRFVLTAFVLIALSGAAHAQGGTVTSGCGDSPENPTAILAMVGSAGAFVAMARRRWFRR